MELNLNGKAGYLDGFLPVGGHFMAAKPQGLVAMWMAGNVATLPMFSLVPGLLAKNVCLVKLAMPDPSGMDRLLAVLAESQADGLSGADLLEAAAVVWFDYRQQELNEEMSLAADARVIWGSQEAIGAITALPRREHCIDVVFGPKYSIGLIDRKRLEAGGAALEAAVAALRPRHRHLRPAGLLRPANHLRGTQCRLLAGPGRADVRPASSRSCRRNRASTPTPRCASPPSGRSGQWTRRRDVIASPDGANWTVCMDAEVSLKEAVQSRTVFLTEVACWQEILPLLGPKVQTVGIAFAERDDAWPLPRPPRPPAWPAAFAPD